jgi:hypothetical protein
VHDPAIWRLIGLLGALARRLSSIEGRLDRLERGRVR